MSAPIMPLAVYIVNIMRLFSNFDGCQILLCLRSPYILHVRTCTVHVLVAGEAAATVNAY